MKVGDLVRMKLDPTQLALVIDIYETAPTYNVEVQWLSGEYALKTHLMEKFYFEVMSEASQT
jgi:hypothetical protein